MHTVGPGSHLCDPGPPSKGSRTVKSQRGCVMARDPGVQVPPLNEPPWLNPGATVFGKEDS